MKFFLKLIPPTATHQMKKVSVVNGKPHYYEPLKVRLARCELEKALKVYAPKTPLSKPLRLKVSWRFPSSKTHKSGTWRKTRPDTDNLQKLLKDQMTHLGFWLDDCQVVSEQVEKLWLEDFGIQVEIEELEEGIDGRVK